MKKEKIKELNIFFQNEYTLEKNIIENNYDDILNLIFELWEFNRPAKIDIYIMKSDFKFAIMTHSIVQKLLLITFYLPFWILFERETRKKWQAVSHFQRKYPIILLKPIEAYDRLDKSIGKHIYIDGKIYKKKDQFLITLCDQLVNICIPPKVPIWINEGISTFTVENFIKKPKYKNESILLLKNDCKMIKNVHELSKVSDTCIAYNYAKGYWTVRYLEENYPGFLKETFMKYEGEEIVERIRLKLGLSEEDFWEQLDELLYENYKHLLDNQ